MNIHHERFISALGSQFQITICQVNNNDYIMEDYDLLIMSPINQSLPALKEDFVLKTLGISLAYDLVLTEGESEENKNISNNLQRFDHVIVDCEYSRDLLLNEFNYSGKISKIVYGCDLPPFVNHESYEEIKIFVTRNWSAIHSNDVILSALQILHSKGVAFSAHFIGEGKLKEHLLTEYAPLISSADIQINGFLTQDKIQDIRNSTWMSISASASDGTSISLLESMSAGQICITTDFQSNLEIIDHGVNGFTFPIGDSEALSMLILDIAEIPKKDLQSIGRAAAEKANTIGNWQKNKIALTNAVYETVQ
jgi:glycosyltransferase involved in cell wall biosynthesis